MRTVFAMWTVLAVAISARGDVFSSEFRALPTEEGWELVAPACGVSAAIENGHYVQRLDPQGCPAPPDGAQETYARSTGSFHGAAGQFVEFRVWTSGDGSGVCNQGPIQVKLSLFGGAYWWIDVTSNSAAFRFATVYPSLPFFFPPGAAHTVRLELEWPLDLAQPIFRFFVDDVFLLNGSVGSSWNDFTLLEWSGTSCQTPIENRWGYIRYGDIPIDGSGDFDSDGLIDQRDYFFFHDCFARRGPGQGDGPGCRFADMDGDTDVDLRDFADFQVRFMDPG